MKTLPMILLAFGITVARDSTTRHEPPDEKTRGPIREFVRKTFAEQFAKSGDEERRSLARILLDKARETTENPAVRFVLARQSLDVAVDVGDAVGSLDAIEFIIADYDIDSIALRKDSFAKLRSELRSRGDRAILADAAFELVDDAIRVERFDIARWAAVAARDLARRYHDRRRRDEADALVHLVNEVKAARERLEGAFDTLRSDPEANAANLTAGIYTSLVKRDWAAGLPLLARSGDPSLERLASNELEPPDSPAGRAAMGELCRSTADGRSELERDSLLARAGWWYEAALPGLDGIERAEAVQHLRSIYEQVERPLSTDSETSPDFALDFSTGVSYVRIPGWRYRGEHPLTIEATVRAHASMTGHTTIVGNLASSGIALGVNANHWSLNFHDGKQYIVVLSERPVELYHRVHLAFVVDEKSVALYVDGKQQRTAVAWSSHHPSPYDAFVGGDPGRRGRTAEQFFRGIIDEVRLSKTARYTKSFKPASRLVPDASTLVLYHFDAREGNIAVDASGNGRHGTIRGTAKRVAFR